VRLATSPISSEPLRQNKVSRPANEKGGNGRRGLGRERVGKHFPDIFGTHVLS